MLLTLSGCSVSTTSSTTSFSSFNNVLEERTLERLAETQTPFINPFHFPASVFSASSSLRADPPPVVFVDPEGNPRASPMSCNPAEEDKKEENRCRQRQNTHASAFSKISKSSSTVGTPNGPAFSFSKRRRTSTTIK
jgi:hypothetical protein